MKSHKLYCAGGATATLLGPEATEFITQYVVTPRVMDFVYTWFPILALVLLVLSLVFSILRFAYRKDPIKKQAIRKYLMCWIVLFLLTIGIHFSVYMIVPVYYLC